MTIMTANYPHLAHLPQILHQLVHLLLARIGLPCLIFHHSPHLLLFIPNGVANLGQHKGLKLEITKCLALDFQDLVILGFIHLNRGHFINHFTGYHFKNLSFSLNSDLH